MDTEGTEAEGFEGEVVEDRSFPMRVPPNHPKLKAMVKIESWGIIFGMMKSSKSFFSIESYGDLGIPHLKTPPHVEGRSQDVKQRGLALLGSCC